MITPLAEADPTAVEALLDAAFGDDRHGRTAYRLRAGMAAIPHLSFAAWDGARLVGTLQSWPVALAGAEREPTPLILLGPVAVAPDHQRGGIGRVLMGAMLAAWDRTDPLVLIGDPEYYGRFFGFRAAPTAEWELPRPVERHRLLVRGDEGRLPRDGRLGPRG